MLNVAARVCLCASLVGVLFPSSTRAEDLTLAWDPPHDGPAPAGYLLRYRPLASTDLTSVDAGTSTTLRVSSLTPGTTYEFFVVAYDEARRTSGPSNVVRVTVDGSAPVPPTSPPPPPSSVTTSYFPGPDDADAVPGQPYRTFLAEGSRSSTFDMRLMLANPGRTPVAATVFLRREGDAESYAGSVDLPPLGHVVVDVDAIVDGRQGTFAIGVTSSAPVGIARTMTWDAGARAHAEAGTAAPAPRWFFAEGASSDRYATYFHVLNPNARAATVGVTYLLPSGEPLVRRHSVPARGKKTIAVRQEGAELARTEVAAVVESLDGQPIVVERAMYLVGRTGYLGGHVALGVSAPRTRWMLAEGVTGSYFSSYVMLANPQDRPTVVELRFRDADGMVARARVSLPAQSRQTVSMADLDPRLADTAVWTEALSLDGVPFVAERVTWWPSTRWGDGHATVPTERPGSRWLAVGGEVGGAAQAVEYLVLANASNEAQPVRLTVLGPKGPVASVRVTIPAEGRLDVDMAATFPDVTGTYSVLAEAAGGPGRFVLEQSAYRNADGVSWSAGTSSRAVPLDE